MNNVKCFYLAALACSVMANDLCVKVYRPESRGYEGGAFDMTEIEKARKKTRRNKSIKRNKRK
jgi:hypothetical protein